jgi:hypothetical protein
MSAGRKNCQIALVLSIFLLSNTFIMGFAVGDPPGEPEEDLFLTMTETVAIDAGEMFYIFFDPSDQSLTARSPPSLPFECQQALSMVPDWMKVNLSYKFRQLDSDFQTIYANLIINSPDPKYIDEIAFVIAHTAVANLQDEYFFPELITHNAQLVYSNDQFLNYVEVIERDDYTTVIYKDRNNLSVELERDIYYFYIVLPKLSDELATYVDPDYDFTKSPPFDRNYGVPPEEGGKFWREWLFYYNDSGYPLLKDKLRTAWTVWEAISACNSWMSGSMSFTSNEERPIQPVRIYRKHIGRCGEYQDMRNAIARAGLIPSTCTINSAEDHVWNEFWDNRWIHWDGGVDNPRMYENGWGKKISSVWNYRGDSSIWSVSDKYTDVCYYTATVLDSEGYPVDGAMVDVLTENYYNPDLLTTTTWGTTDYTGTVMIPLGDERNFWSAAESDSLGDDPANGVTQVIENSVAWQNYSHTFHLPMSAEQLNVEEITNPGIIDPKYRMNVKYEVVANILETENSYSSEEGDWYSQGGNIDFFIADSLNYNLFVTGVSFDAYNVDISSNSGEHLFILPDDDTYFNVLSNEFAQETCKIVRITVEVYSSMQLAITTPSNGANFNLGDQIHITGTAWAPNSIQDIKISWDNSGEYVFAWDTSTSQEPPYATWEYYMSTDELLPGDYMLWVNATSYENYTRVGILITLHDATDPQLQVDHPLENSQHVNGDIITVNGTAMDNVEVSKLEIVVDFDHANPIDITSYLVDSEFAYDLGTNGWIIGDHSITTTVIDSSANSWFITRNIKIIELVDPVVLIEAPSQGNYIKLGDIIVISGVANDNEEVVLLQLKIGDEPPIDITPDLLPDGTWSYEWDTGSFAEGPITIEISAQDYSQNVGTHTIDVILDGTPPETSLISPEDQSKYKIGDIIFLEGTASDNYGIYKVLLDFEDAGYADLTQSLENGMWTYELDTQDLGEGEHVITYLVADLSIQATVIERTIYVQEAENPLVYITAPKDKHMVKGGEIMEIRGSAYDNKDIAKLELIIGSGSPVDITSLLLLDGSWSYELDTGTISSTEHIITIVATDSADNLASDSITIIVDGEEPSVSIALKENRIYSVGESIELYGGASDDKQLSRLILQLDDGSRVDILGKVKNNDWEYEFTGTNGLTSGEHTFYITAIDSVGQESKAAVDVVIDSEFPEAEIREIEESIMEGDVITITGSARDDIEVTKILVFIDDEEPFTLIPSNTNDLWQFELDTKGMSPGKHTISVMVHDIVGNEVYSESRFRIQEEPTTFEEVQEPEEDENKIGPFEMDMFLLMVIITIMCIIVIVAIAASRGRKKK